MHERADALKEACLVRRRILVDEAAECGEVRRGGFRIALAVGVKRDRIEPVQHSCDQSEGTQHHTRAEDRRTIFEGGLNEVDVESGSGRPNQRFCIQFRMGQARLSHSLKSVSDRTCAGRTMNSLWPGESMQ